MLHPFACCMLLRVVMQSLKPVKILAPCKRAQHCWELLRPFARSWQAFDDWYATCELQSAYIP